MPQINYWERKKSFWSTPKGIIIELVVILALLTGSILTLNIISSPYPVIEHFEASPVAIAPGESSTLSWSVVGASGLSIDQGIGQVELKGSRVMMPKETVIYTLTAVNESLNRSRSSSVRVLVES